MQSDDSDDFDLTDDFEVEDPQNELDALSVSVEDFDGLVLAPSDWTVGTIYDQIGKQIDLDPEFQRRDVWSRRAKSQFIESIFLGVPIPQILLSSKRESRNEFLVLDGKQRLTTIKEFFDGKYTDQKTFRLRGLSVLENDLSGKTWQQIEKIDDWRNRFRNATIRTAVLRGWQNESVLYEIFHRLNSGSVRLSPMELRMSLHPGAFLKFIISWTSEIGPLHTVLNKTVPDQRMRDVELAIRYLAFADQNIEYKGNLKEFLDDCSLQYNANFEDDDFRDTIVTKLQNLNHAIDEGMDIFGPKCFSKKWTGREYEFRFNRAIFDVMAGSLSDEQFRMWAHEHPVEVQDSFKKLCVENKDFIRAVESTTKTPENTRKRFEAWYNAVKEVSGIELAVPNIKPE
jgi:hypothetical protein